MTLNEEIRKLSNKQTNKRCSRTVHEQIYKHQTLKRAVGKRCRPRLSDCYIPTTYISYRNERTCLEDKQPPGISAWNAKTVIQLT